ncbi:phage tail protein [Undibacterium aquatile]|uniref:Tail fiber protein n=1 Tax=Undibacterium aquatile TaxID=1537398 RepID=A0ABR6XC11_9BURK|nr:phage tail protein [Undibacterium aquatile]MBC3810455.1 tail fiber protein [Undibacterium aquatile]
MKTPGAATINASGIPGLIRTEPPVGSIVAFAGDATKNTIESSGWMVCDGRALNVEQYPVLFAVIGYRFGGSDGQFHIPQADVANISPVGDATETRPTNITISQLIRFV